MYHWNKYKGLLLLTLMTFMFFTLSGMAWAAEGEVAKNILYHATGSTPFTNLDPSVEWSNGVMIMNNVYEGLTYYNYETGKVDPMLAESWSRSEDGKTWTFKIRQGVKFHDGADLDAEAVKKSIDRTIKLGQGAVYIWDSVKSIEVIDKYEVKFNLKYSAPLDVSTSAAYAAFIISPNAVEKDSDWFNLGNSAGTGPYKINKAISGEEVILEKFDDYWKPWKDNQYTYIIVKKVPESSVKRKLLEKGEAQISSDFSSTDINALMTSDKVKVIRRPLWQTLFLCLNTEKYPCNNVDFRRALSYAFPYEETVNNVLEGRAVQSYGFIPKGLWGHSENLPQYKCDLDKAKEYLDKSGVKTDGLTLELTHGTQADEYAIYSQLYQLNLKKLGINLAIRPMTWDLQWAKGNNPDPNDRQDMFLFIIWPDYPTPNTWFVQLLSSTSPFNLSYINDPTIDAKIKEASTLEAVDRDKAEQMYLDLQKEVLDKAYYVSLYDKVATYVLAKDLKGFTTNPAYSEVVRYFDLHK